MGESDEGRQLVQGQAGQCPRLVPGQAAMLVEEGTFGGGEGQRKLLGERLGRDRRRAYRLPWPDPSDSM
jgi:hypothetical protein